MISSSRRRTRATSESLRKRVTLCAAVTLAYVLAFVPLYQVSGRLAVAAAILPVMVLGNSFGSWCGFIAGAMQIPLNASLLLLAGETSVSSFTGQYFWPVHFTFILVGTVIGRLRNDRLRLERALEEKEIAEDAFGAIVRATEQSPASVVVTDIGGNITHFAGEKEDITDRKRSEEESERLVSELQSALARIKTLSGLLSMCSNCKKIKDDRGLWQHVETYVRRHSNAEISHGFCPDCMSELYPGYSLEDG